MIEFTSQCGTITAQGNRFIAISAHEPKTMAFWSRKGAEFWLALIDARVRARIARTGS